MAGQRKLLSEIDRTLKKVSEGVDVFNDIWDKVYAASAQNQKEKHEADLKKEIKKLQRFRDQIKTWIGNSDVKDKRPLVETRKLIEQKMEEFKVCEKETKTKAYSKEGLAQVERLDPEQQARQESHAWIQDCLNQFNVQIEALESDVERLHSAKGRNRNKSEIDEKEKLLSRHKWHILKLEQINRLLDNSALEPDQVDELKEDVDYYLEANQEPDFMETYGDDDIYELLDLDTLGAAAQVALPTEQDVGIDDASSTTSASSATAAPPTITTTSGRGKTPRKSATSSMITGIGRAGAVKPIDLKASTPSRSSSASKSDTSPNGIKTDDLKIGKGRSTPQRAKSGSSDKGAGKTTTSVPSSPAVGEQRTPVRKVSPPTPQRSPSPSIGKGHVASNPGIKVFAVEPTGAADAYNSFQKRELTGHTGPVSTVADGLRTTLGRCIDGDNNWPVVRDFVDEVLLVSDDEIVSAMKLIWERMKLVVEPSGAVATAAVLAHKLPAGINNVGIVFSGGNVDLEKLPWTPKVST
uniref:CCR4-Not complex component Not N-terminal domain-containing protein n=1 Tax=Phytophthora ramorum TaxID=164328 RepID=H3H0Y8_PHYRM